MVAEAALPLDSEPPSGVAVPIPMRTRAPRALAALAAGLLVGTVLDQVFAPAASFRTQAVVGMSDSLYGAVPASVRAATEQASMAAVLSRGVLVRAAAALRDKGVAGPEPSLLDRLAVAAGLQSATSGGTRIEQMLAARVGAARGTTPGTVAIVASDARPEGAALIANAIAEAFVADQDQAAADLRRARDGAAAARTKSLVEAAETARRRLSAFGSASLDPVEDRAEAARATEAAKARLDAFRAVIASGSPPLGAPAGLPSTIAPLQADYLELKRQLLDVRRTLGERHTTVIGLEDGLRQAAKSLSAEWKRLAQSAEADWKRAGETESQLARADTSRDAKTRAAIDAARDGVKAADMALARFQAGQTGLVATDQHYRLIAPAPVPSAEAGLPVVPRLCLDAAAALAAAVLAAKVLAAKVLAGNALALRARRRRDGDAFGDERDDPASTPAHVDAAWAGKARAMDQAVTREQASTMDEVWTTDDTGTVDETAIRRAEQARPATRDQPARHGWGRERTAVARPAAAGLVAPPPAADEPRRAGTAFKPRLVTQDRPAMAPASRDSWPPGPQDRPRATEPQGPLDVVADLALVEPGNAAYAVVLVGGSEPASLATPVVLALARGAAAAGRRVLLIEAARPRPMLASAVGLGARPMLVDVLGMLRVALPDDRAGTLLLAPAFPELRRFAAGLALRDDVAFVDETIDAFDLVIIDIGSPEAAAEDWSGIADASIRIGRSRARREEEAFLAATGGTFARFLGTIAAAPAPRLAQSDLDLDEPLMPPRTTAGPPSPRRIPVTGAPAIGNAEPPFRKRERRKVAGR